MCLATLQREPLITEEDITVYKVFTSEDKSPYQRFDYTPYIGKLFTDPNPDDTVFVVVGSGGQLNVYGGFIHSYTKLQTARNIVAVSGQKIRKCTIPKGTKIFISESKYEIASKSIIIGDRICV